MKKSFLILSAIALVAVTGCFSAHKKTESLHSTETFNEESGKLTKRVVIRDRSKGGGVAVLSDPKVTQISSAFTNQTKLGGGSTMNVGKIESITSTNGIEALGNAGGKLLNSTVTGGN